MKTRRTRRNKAFARFLELAILASVTVQLTTPAHAQQPKDESTGASVGPTRVTAIATNDFIRRVEVSPKLPAYRFVLQPDSGPDNDRPPSDGHIGRVEVFEGTSKTPRQIIDVVGVHPSWLTNSFHPVDINMDGYQDLAVIYEVGGKWHSESYWLFEPKSGLFITNALTADLRKLEHNGLTLFPQKKEIRASYFIGVCLKSFAIYRIEHGRLVLQESEMHTPITLGRCLVEKRKRINGEMVLIEKAEQKHDIPPGWQESPAEQ